MTQNVKPEIVTARCAALQAAATWMAQAPVGEVPQGAGQETLLEIAEDFERWLLR